MLNNSTGQSWISSKEFTELKDILKSYSGQVLLPGQIDLANSRLPAIMQKFNCHSFSQMMKNCKTNESLAIAICEAMAVHESLFFRDQYPFDLFKRLLENRAPTLPPMRIWSAGCSTGQEAYSLLIIASELGKKVDLVASDFSQQVVDKAKSGQFTQFEVQRGMPIRYLIKYFDKLEKCWQLKNEIRAQAKFMLHNLLQPLNEEAFDLVFCRNVLIYFDPATKKQVLKNLAAAIQSHGFLVLGSSENLVGIESHLVPYTGMQGVYQFLNN